jgi:hypothetical protein
MKTGILRLGLVLVATLACVALGLWFEPVGTNTGRGINFKKVAGTASVVAYSGGGSRTLEALLADEHGVIAGTIGESVFPLATRTGSSPFHLAKLIWKVATETRELVLPFAVTDLPIP